MRRTLALRPATEHFVESYPGLVVSQGDAAGLHPGGRQLAADLLRPVTDAPVPLVLFFKGGGFRNQWRAKYSPQLVGLAQRGVAVASVEYRTSNEAPFPAQLHDAKAAVRWFRARADQLRIDPERIGVWGNSAGGTLAALLGVTGDDPSTEGTGDHRDHSSAVQAVVDWYGVTDMLRMPGADEPGSTVATLLGGPVPGRVDLARAASAVHQVGSGRELPPFLVVHGDHDTTVPPEQSEALVTALEAAGGDVTHLVVHGAGHSFSTISMRSDALALTVDFLLEHLSAARAGARAA